MRILRRSRDLPEKDEAGPRGLVLGQAVAPLAGVALLAARHGSEVRTVVRVGRDCSIGKEGTVTVIAGPCPSNPNRNDGAAAMATATACTSCAAAPSNPAPDHIASRARAWRGRGCREGRRALRAGHRLRGHHPEDVDPVGEYRDVIQIGAATCRTTTSSAAPVRLANRSS